MENTANNMDKTYNPQGIERDIYDSWEKSGAFTAKRVEGKKPFTIVMPPPNITGQLHMGHAMDCLLQDSLARYHRMKGDPTLWLPGTDHASIATEVKVVEKLAAQGIDKKSISREEFLEHAWEWKEEYGGRITQQLRRLGASCDWSRERFTLDEDYYAAVREVFVRMYEKGLIYRGNRIVNWCSVCQTALSDAEVEHEEQASFLWHIRYPASDGGEGVVVATTRPETMLGDTGVAVNPEDKRYIHLHGKTVTLPLSGRNIPIVADSYVDISFGTGAVKMTPAHDPNDFEVAERTGLAILNVINPDGTMNDAAGTRYAGLSALDCRKLVVEDLQKLGLIIKIEPYTHQVGTCYRCHTTVDPLISLQWFVHMEPLAQPAIEAVRNNQTKFVPDRFSKVYFNWMENIRDWCISRQLWWGHRIPAWYCESCGEIIVSREAPDICPVCQSSRLKQDEDVLDTWFSSALWPFATLGWPENTDDLKYFYPTSTLVTGYDIIFFWVARMIFSGIEYMGEVPFDTVLIHGLVRDALGRKMSKSLGNGIDPLDIIEAYGADALRFSLCQGISPGADTRFSTERVESARNFANKVWNAARFVLMNLEGEESLEGKSLGLADKWILSRAMEAIKEIGEHFEQNEHGLAASKIYDFAWGEFCDWYIELAKADLFGEDIQRKQSVRAVLQFVLEALLKMLHPFMPFITEELYRYLPGREDESCMLSKWPIYVPSLHFAHDADQMQGVMDIIRAVRNLRAELKVQPGQKARLMLKAQGDWHSTLDESRQHFMRLASASSVELLDASEQIEGKIVSAVTSAAEILIPLGDLVDFKKEILRMQKEYDNLSGEIMRSQAKLNNDGFLNKAPESLVLAEKQKLEENMMMLNTMEQRLIEMKS
ncbi:MAG: valine--tRNA ligase [Clostridiales bacterium]|nr:valine--tRNA ligase [Clostridiales bacterium]